jgi:cell wall-associated NlpC family hydrolase
VTGTFSGSAKHAAAKNTIATRLAAERRAAVRIAEKYLGVPYVWGGASPSGFDTSGLVMYVYAQLGVSLPHYTVSQYNYPTAVHVSRWELRPGDLVFFDGLGHVGIYIGNNEFIDAPHTGAVVRIESLTGWYSAEYYGATRILGAGRLLAKPVRYSA